MIYILSGPSGAGKSTWVAQLGQQGVVVSADHFHMPKLFQDAGISFYLGLNIEDCAQFQEQGSFHYSFNPEMLADAHPGCFRAYLQAIQDEETVVVDNTNVWAAEKAPYYLAAQAYGRDVTIVRFETSLDRCIEQSKIPEEVVRKQWHVHQSRTHQGHLREHMPWWEQQTA